MSVKEIRIYQQFEKSYKKLSQKVKARAAIKERVFRENPFHPTLKTHKLHGKEKEMWAFWINQKYRIKFIFLEEGVVLFLDIGTHDIYE